MKKFQKVFLLISFLLFVQINYAQFRFEQISSNDGLSHNTVRSIIQDRNGFLWIGTYYGINKYDGYTMQHYKFSNKPNGLSSNIILSLFEDKEGNIWAGTTHGGLNRINTETGEVNIYFNDSHDVNYTKEITDIFQSESGLMFIVHKEGIKVFQIDDDGKVIYEKMITKVGQEELGIRSIFKARDGSHWLFTPNKDEILKKIKISLKNKAIQSVVQKTNIQNFHFKDGYLVNLIEYPKNTLWLLSNELMLLKIQLDDQMHIVDEKFIDLLSDDHKKNVKKYSKLSFELDKNNKLWIAGNDLLIRYDIDKGESFQFKKNKHSKIKLKYIEDILVDHSNILWIGSSHNGLFKMDLENHTFLNSTDFLENTDFDENPIMAISQDDRGNIWFGSQQNNGIMIIKEKEIQKSLTHRSFDKWTPFFIKKNNNSIFYRIKRLMKDREGNMWVGAKGGLSRIKYIGSPSKYDISTFEINDLYGKKIVNAAFAIEEDFNENIWIGYWLDGLVKLTLNKKDNSYTNTNYQFSKEDPNSLSNNYVRDILEDHHKNLWIGTIEGLNKLVYDANGKVSFKRYLNEPNNKKSLSNNYILDLFESKNGDIYIGTLGGGLNKIEFLYNDELSFQHYSTVDGLPSDVIFQIREDLEGNIWMQHVRSISRLNPKTGEITYFDNKDGFTVDEFKDNAMTFTSSGTMIIGGLNGFSFFQPNNISINKIKPQLAIEDFKLFDASIQPLEKIKNHIILQKDINETKKISLPYYLNSMEFVFSSLHFSNPEKNKYKYILEGFNKKWQYSMGNERRFASYTNVPAGEYTFKVFGSNSSGIWTDNPRKIEIVINSPWYFTPWAILIYLLLIVSVIFGLTRIRLNQVRLESKLALESALHEKADELNKMKLQFFTNISHELRTPLTLIIGPLQQILQGNTDPVYLKKLNSIMYKNSVRLLKLINQLLDFRKAESGNIDLLVQKDDMVEFVQEISNAFEEIATVKDIKFLFLSEEKSLEGWFDKDKIEKILYNLLSNAFKFTPKGKGIKITLKKIKKDGKRYAKIKVIDYGIGIAKEDLENVFEQFYQSKKENNSIHIGSGLGLAYTKHLVEIHKGKIKIDSKLHKGTTCTVLIPVSKSAYESKSIIESQLNQYDFRFTKNEIEEIKENDVIQTEVSKINPDKNKDGKEEIPTILIVEDNVELRSYLFNYFSNDYKVVTAEDGIEGVECAIDHAPNIIISDLMMPRMDGIEMCKKIKTNIHTSHIPVIILTAKAGIENEKEGLETGADEFVLKPFNIEILKLRIENILRTRKKWIQQFRSDDNTQSVSNISNKLDQQFLNKAIEIVNNNVDNVELSVEMFAGEIAMSRSALFKKLKSTTGQSTSEFIRSIRLKKAINYLKSGEYSITEVIFMVGFSDPKYFRTCFKKQFGKTPSEYIKSLK